VTLHIIIHCSFCVPNFTLPEGKPNFAEFSVTHKRQSPTGDVSRCQAVSVETFFSHSFALCSKKFHLKLRRTERATKEFNVMRDEDMTGIVVVEFEQFFPLTLDTGTHHRDAEWSMVINYPKHN
jgi:hypothetical protein